MRSKLGLRGGSMTDPDEVQLGKLAKKMLAMPPNKRKDSKLGKPRMKPNNSPAPRAQTKKPGR
jgi:hypothetical protein